jgi:tetratricopeptide (TPR) repeat protein
MPHPASVSSPRFRLPPWLAVVCIVAVVCIAYANTINVPFVFDDAGAVQHNPTIRRLDSLAVLRPPPDGSTTTGRPVVNFSLAVNYAVSGESVWSYHATNIAIHTLAALALFGLIRRTLSRPAWAGSLERERGGPASSAPLVASSVDPTTVAALAALLWAVHPLLTESVTCIAQRTESLCGLWYLFTLFAFVRGADSSAEPGARRRWWAASVLACALGMATKEVMVTAPLLVFLYDRTFVAGTFAAAWRKRRGYYGWLASTWAILGFLLLAGAGARGASAGFGLGVTPWSYLLKQCEALVLYLRLALWPDPLVLDYGTDVPRFLIDVAGQGSVVVLLLAGTGWALVKRPRLGWVGACFFVVLAPSSSFVPLVTQTMAEHRMYLPLAGLVAAAVVAVVGRFGGRAVWVAIGLIVVGTVLTVARNRDYRDAVTLWSNTVLHRPANPRAHNNLAQALQEAGRVVEAEPHFARAVELAPDYVSARYNYGVALLARGQVAAAAAQLEAVVRLAPDHADAQLNLGNALVRLQRSVEAIPHYERALALQPGSADVHYNLGIALLEVRETVRAGEQFQAALRLAPGLVEARYQLARAAEQAGDTAEAERGYAEILRLSPDHLDAHRRLGLLCARRERLPEAATHFRAVIRLQPGDADAHANLGNVLLLSGQPREAIASYEESLRLRPGDARTRENLALARQAAR